MNRTIKQISFSVPQVPKLKKVAAYARVSSGKDSMLHSLSAQVSHYNDLIQQNPRWLFCGVYADEALTGTKANRENFTRLLKDCKAGKIDMVITKSISRFARNTLDLLKTVRMLKGIGVDVYFEEQNIHSVSSDGELLLTILASYAQEESLSASENQKWRIRRNFENGMPWSGTMLGYRYNKGKYEVVPDEAETVKNIFKSYLSGMGYVAIAKMLNEKGIPTRFGNSWGKSSIVSVLSNYSYTGNLMLQQTYRENHLTKFTLQNNGELPKYHVFESHKAIISLEDFNAVQNEMKRRAEKHNRPGRRKCTYPFTGKIVCGICGKHYRRKVTKTGVKWICPTYNEFGKSACTSKQIPEDTLISITTETTGSLDALNDKITVIRAENDNTLVFCLIDGKTIVNRWKDRSRAESWTEEMKEAARQTALERSKKNG